MKGKVRGWEGGKGEGESMEGRDQSRRRLAEGESISLIRCDIPFRAGKVLAGAPPGGQGGGGPARGGR